MSAKPTVKPGDIIKIGVWDKTKQLLDTRRNGVVSLIHENKEFGDIEAVYINEKDEAINDDFSWDGNAWDFTRETSGGGYAIKAIAYVNT